MPRPDGAVLLTLHLETLDRTGIRSVARTKFTGAPSIVERGSNDCRTVDFRRASCVTQHLSVAKDTMDGWHEHRVLPVRRVGLLR